MVSKGRSSAAYEEGLRYAQGRTFIAFRDPSRTGILTGRCRSGDTERISYIRVS